MKTLIIQTSPPHTASTFLVNAIYGLIPELSDKSIMYEELDESENIIVMKSHNDIDDLIKQYNNKYKLIFISSERKDMDISIDEKYKTYKNVILFDYNELNETTTNTLIKIVDNIYNKVKNVLFNIKLDKTKCIDRINLMNIKYEQIKHEPFTYIDELFALHGSHRNRKE
jgi:hypothetical protein